jgi:hypothetical protein
MKNALLLLVTVFVLLAQTASSMPLVFKVDREVRSVDESIFLDTSKFRQVRVAAVLVGSGATAAEKSVKISAVEGDETFSLFSLTLSPQTPKRLSSVIDGVPSKIRITFDAPGKYRIFVWGS